MQDSKLKVFGLVLVAVALLIVGGVALLRSKIISPINPINTTNNSYPSPNTTARQVGNTNVPILQTSPSAQEVKQYLETVQKQAVEADTVSFLDCKAQPAVIKLKVGSKLTLKNSDNKAIVTNINFDNNFPVPASGSVSITPKLVEGTYYMSCQHQASDYVDKAVLIEVSK